jgi:hypothetical protein
MPRAQAVVNILKNESAHPAASACGKRAGERFEVN